MQVIDVDVTSDQLKEYKEPSPKRRVSKAKALHEEVDPNSIPELKPLPPFPGKEEPIDYGEFPVEIVPIDALNPHPRNYRVHPEDQVLHLIESIKEHGLYRPIVVAEDYTILAGHGVVVAARKMGLATIPVRMLPIHPDDPRALKLLTGDNEISHLGEVDEKALASILSQIQEEDASGLLGTGYDEKKLIGLIMGIEAQDEEKDGNEVYTSKIQVPTYSPSDVQPRVSELYDDSKTKLLMQQIDAAKWLSNEEREFLMLAAQRHTVLHFNKIADYYAHASASVQSFMEQSALVILDIDRAIELGYVELTNRLAGMVEEEYGEE